MTENDKGSANGGMTRKERRAAQRAARKNRGAARTTTSSKAGNGSGPSMLLISLGAVALGVVALVALVLISGGFGGDDGEISEPDTPAPAAELRQGRTLVAAEASDPVVVEVYEDVQCPHCQTFTERVEPLIIAEHVSDGTASLTYYDYIVFGEDSLDAAVAMRAAEELDGAFWDYHHVLFHNAADGPFTRTWLADIAEEVGLDGDAFLDLLDDGALRDDVSEDIARAASFGISSTPSVVVDGELLETPSWENIDAAIESAAAAD